MSLKMRKKCSNLFVWRDYSQMPHTQGCYCTSVAVKACKVAESRESIQKNDELMSCSF